MTNIFNNADLAKISSEELVLAIEELQKEKTRRLKIDKRNATIEFREALGKFIDSGACYDFACYCGLTTGDVEITFAFDSECTEDDIKGVDVQVFNREILLCMKNELTRCIGNYEG